MGVHFLHNFSFSLGVILPLIQVSLLYLQSYFLSILEPPHPKSGKQETFLKRRDQQFRWQVICKFRREEGLGLGGLGERNSVSREMVVEVSLGEKYYIVQGYSKNLWPFKTKVRMYLQLPNALTTVPGRLQQLKSIHFL